MNTNARRHSALPTAALGALLLAGCAACSSGSAASPTVPPAATATVRPQYVALAEAVAAHGAKAWIEADLIKAWLAGPEPYGAALETVVKLADRQGVAGVKIADELGYEDDTDATTVLAFLKSTTATLHSRLPGRKVVVDLIVPELGCLSWSGVPDTVAGAASADGRRACGAAEVARNPAVALAAIDGYIAGGGLDVVDLSAGLRTDGEYAEWGTTRDAAMAAAWDEASRRWGSKVRLQARKALAHPGPYEGSKATAEADMRTYVDIPLAHGAHAVDIWTWSQPYKGGTYTLTDPKLAPNDLTRALLERRRRGVELWTHMTPSSLQVGLDQDVASAVSIFSGVLVASGTG
ncbi:hypothetical protein [Intrasporangium flavum]|uniref:hypothetical protein n=1 Tax=Intrasporangium flavum TaxID=1428657 RepID=UPI00096D956D|nr:hypothetical protein [Intrasporangium flavum]